MKVLIVEDEKVFQETIEKNVRALLPGARLLFAKKLDEILEPEQPYDLCLMDIGLPDGDGLRFVQSRSRWFQAVLYITSFEERVYEAFGQNVYGFVRKSRLEADLATEIKKALTALSRRRPLLVVEETGQERTLLMEQILFVQTDRRKLTIQLAKGSITLKRQAIKEFAQALDDRFIWISQSTLIHADHVKAWNKDEITMDNNMTVFASRRFLKAARRAYLERLYVPV